MFEFCDVAYETPRASTGYWHVAEVSVKWRTPSVPATGSPIVHGLVAVSMHPPKKNKKNKKNKQTTTNKQQQQETKLGGYFIVAWVPLVKKNDVNRKKTNSQDTCHAPF